MISYTLYHCRSSRHPFPVALFFPEAQRSVGTTEIGVSIVKKLGVFEFSELLGKTVGLPPKAGISGTNSAIISLNIAGRKTLIIVRKQLIPQLPTGIDKTLRNLNNTTFSALFDNLSIYKAFINLKYRLSSRSSTPFLLRLWRRNKLPIDLSNSIGILWQLIRANPGNTAITSILNSSKQLQSVFLVVLADNCCYSESGGLADGSPAPKFSACLRIIFFLEIFLFFLTNVHNSAISSSERCKSWMR